MAVADRMSPPDRRTTKDLPRCSACQRPTTMVGELVEREVTVVKTRRVKATDDTRERIEVTTVEAVPVCRECDAVLPGERAS